MPETLHVNREDIVSAEGTLGQNYTCIEFISVRLSENDVLKSIGFSKQYILIDPDQVLNRRPETWRVYGMTPLVEGSRVVEFIRSYPGKFDQLRELDFPKIPSWYHSEQ